MQKLVLICLSLVLWTGCAKEVAEKTESVQTLSPSETSTSAAAVTFESFDELDPYAENIEQQLEELDQDYFESTGLSPYLFDVFASSQCKRKECKVWLQVVKSTQLAYLYVDGVHKNTFKVSTGAPGHGTPNFDRHPNGRIYDRYSSKKFPGGDYNGLGNMPYAVFIENGFAVHGTAKSNWKKLGSRASHGCIRMHPDNALIFNRLVRQYGIYKTWITVQN